FVLIDINMPKMNGIQCLPEIKKLDHLRDSKIVMYSTSSDESVKQATKQLGADGFLVKVPKLSSLVNHLSLILKKGEI
ncbi:MAG: response regulator, partial [Proteobacteria bacterium]